MPFFTIAFLVIFSFSASYSMKKESDDNIFQFFDNLCNGNGNLMIPENEEMDDDEEAEKTEELSEQDDIPVQKKKVRFNVDYTDDLEKIQEYFEDLNAAHSYISERFPKKEKRLPIKQQLAVCSRILNKTPYTNNELTNLALYNLNELLNLSTNFRETEDCVQKLPKRIIQTIQLILTQENGSLYENLKLIKNMLDRDDNFLNQEKNCEVLYNIRTLLKQAMTACAQWKWALDQQKTLYFKNLKNHLTELNIYWTRVFPNDPLLKEIDSF